LPIPPNNLDPPLTHVNMCCRAMDHRAVHERQIGVP
jgi:hypothetical protein